MKKLIRVLILVLACAFLSGSLVSCSVFDKSAKFKHESFKHKNPIPKKWVINNGTKRIAK